MTEQIENPVETVENVVPAPAPVATPAVEPLAETVIDKTKEQFQKLLESNKRLNEANEVLRQQLQQPAAQVSQPAPQSQSVSPSDFIDSDPQTGERYFNEAKFTAKMNEIQARQQEIADKANNAESTIQSYLKISEDREIERQEKETFSAHPELNPNAAGFDPVLNKQVRGILIDSYQNPSDYDNGRPLSFKEAADFVKNIQGKTTQVAQPDPAQLEAESQAAQQLKEQATSSVASQPRAQESTAEKEELEGLIYRTRYLADDSALAERLKHTEHILPKEQS